MEVITTVRLACNPSSSSRTPQSSDQPQLAPSGRVTPSSLGTPACEEPCGKTARQLKKLMVGSSYPRGSKWIAENDLTKVWTDSWLQHFSGHYRWNLQDDERARIQSSFKKVLSILVWITWQDWGRFADLFLRQFEDSICDSQLPLTQNDTARLEKYMSHAKAELFISNQYQFTPLIIQEGTLKQLEYGWILPFLMKDHSNLGGGASSSVFEETIPAGYFQWKRKGKNEESLSIARKVVSDATAINEAKCVRLILDSVQSHEYVVRNLAILVHDQSYHFLYPLADTNLDQFLRIDSYAGCLDGPESFVIIMPKIAHLAHALRFLHQELREPETRNQVFCHMDFKPENILVTETNTVINYKFLITDLGLSAFRPDPRDNNRLKELNPNEVTKTKGRRGAGTYQAPEMGLSSYVGRKSDVWSLACIIITILTRAILGKDELARFNKQREANSFDEGDDYFYFSDGSAPKVLNSAVESWLSGFASRNGQYVDKLTSDLGLMEDPITVIRILDNLCCTLRQALAIQEQDRIGISEFLKSLDNICGQLHELTKSPHLSQITSPVEIITTLEEPNLRFLSQFEQTEELAKLSRRVSQIKATTRVDTSMRTWLQSVGPSSVLLYNEPSCDYSQFSGATKCLWAVARTRNYPVFACLSGSRFTPRDSPVMPFVYLVRCLIVQLLKCHLQDQKSFDLNKLLALATVDGTLNAGVEIVRQLLFERNVRCIILIDDFALAYSGEKDMDSPWQKLFAVLGCGNGEISCAPGQGTVKVFIRSSSSAGGLRHLGFGGNTVDGKAGRKDKFYKPMLERFL